MQYPDEIVIYDNIADIEYCETTDERDFGYFERIVNPNNSKTNIILIGGCHTIGVTGAVKAFSMAESERGEIPNAVLQNAKLVASALQKKTPFSIILRVNRIGQTIAAPIVKAKDIAIGQTDPV